MTKDEFVKGYCERSKIPWDELKDFLVPLPCHCDYEGCTGWAMVHNDPMMIEEHMRDYGELQE